MANKCDTELIKLKEDSNVVERLFQLELEDSLGKLIGFPQDGNPQYKKHKLLYDSMFDYITESGRISHFSLDPHEAVKQWGQYFSDKYLEEITSSSVFNSPRKVGALYNKFQRVVKERKKRIKKNKKRGNMSPTSVALLPPSILAMKEDRFGFISRLVDKTKSLSDNIRQSYVAYDTKLKDSLLAYARNIDRIYPNVDNAKVMNGIYGLTDKEANPIIIRDVKKNKNGENVFFIEYENDNDLIDYNDRERVWISQKKLGISKDAYDEAFKRKYIDEFFNDLLHGQTRQIKWKTRKDLLKNKKHSLTYEHIMAREQVRKKTDDVRDDSPEVQNLMLEIEGEEYRVKYTMIKEIDFDGEEVYNAYITAIQDATGEWHNKDYLLETLVLENLKDGFYRALKSETRTDYQQIMDSEKLSKIDKMNKKAKTKELESFFSNEDHIVESAYNIYTDFEYMNQPDELMIKASSSRKGKAEPKNIWEMLKDHRDTFKDIGDDIQAFVKKNLMKRRKLEATVKGRLLSKGMSEEEAKEWMDEHIYSVADTDTAAWEYEGKIYTKDGQFSLLKDNYGPMLWSKKEYNRMTDKRQRRIEQELEEGSLSDTEVLSLEKQLKDIIRIRRNAEGLDEESSSVLIDSQSSLYTERREVWTNNLTRRRDGRVTADYMDRTFRNLHKNSTIINLLESIDSVLNVETHMPNDILDYMTNRVKTSFGKTDTKTSVLTPLGWKKVDNIKIANVLNKLPSILRGGRTWDANSAEKLWLTWNGLLTMNYLGAAGAAGNRTQSANLIVRWGWNKWWDTRRKMSEDPDFWERVSDNAGITNILSVFHDMMLGGGESEFSDQGFLVGSQYATEAIMGAPIPLPTLNFKRWRQVLRASKDSFVKNGDKSIDHILLKLIKKDKLRGSEGDIQYARQIETILNISNNTGMLDVNKLTAKQKLDLKAKREAWYDLFTLSKDQNEKDIVEARLKNLLGNIEQHQLKTMITFKLSFWWGKDLGKEMFTFTEGERYMRKEAAVMSLLIADDMGTLGKGEDRFFSPIAIKIARDAVYNTMFGMSTEFLGDAFTGIGKSFGQYKSYPLFQTIKDWNTVENYIDSKKGRSSLLESPTRLISALWDSHKDGGYDPSNKKLDHEALALLRLITIRGTATALTSIMHVFPLGARLLRGGERVLGFGAPLGAVGTMRAVENPMFAFTFRLALWSLLMATAGSGSDEEKKLKNDWFTRIAFLTIPALIVTFIRWTYGTLDKMYED